MDALVLGIDSASPYLIQKWIDKLPNIRSVVERGAQGILQSIVPPESVPAWQCFATGKNPAKIGVYGFLYIGRDRKLKRGKTTAELGCFWDICSKKGMKVGVFNFPGTYPPYSINGFMVSGFPVPHGKVWSYPEDLMKKIDSAVGGYEIDVPLSKPSDMKGGEEAHLGQVQRLHDKCLQTAKLLIEWYNPDVFAMTFQGLDLVQHDLWRYMDRPDSPYSNALRDWYVNIDNAVGDLVRLVGSNTHVLLLSDHGSAPCSSALYVNRLLESRGLLTLKGPVKQKGEVYTKLRKWVLKKFSPETLATLYRLTPEFISHKLTYAAAIERTLQGLIDNIDWDKTLAFSTGGHQAHIYINYDLVKKREDQDTTQTLTGVVNQLCDLMISLTNPKTGQKLTPVFHFKEQTFTGPYQYDAPDLCVELYSGNEKIQINPRLGTKALWNYDPHFSSIHSRDGFWAMMGPRVKPGVKMDASLLDLTPTILKVLGVNSTNDFDGHALDRIIAS